MDRYTVGLAGELVRQGVQVALFHRERQPLNPSHVAGLGCQVVGLPDKGGLYWEQVAVPLALWKGRFDLFHAPAEHGVPLAAPCPTILTLHSVTLHSYTHLVRRGLLRGRVRDYLGYEIDPNTRTLPACYRRAQIARADHVLTPSDFCRSEVLRFLKLPPARVTTTYLAVHDHFRRPRRSDAERSSTLQRFNVRRPYVLNVGGYEPHKNVSGLLRTFARVKQERPDLSLVVVGSKVIPDSVHQAAQQLGLEHGRDVVFLANVHEELVDLYDAAEIFVTLSWRETFCLPALEALVRAVPVVASSWGATPEVVGAAGCLVDPRDEVRAACAILDLLRTADRIVLEANARRALQQFTWSNTAWKTRQIYHALLGANQASAG
jgi:glycosyltransferase involved in cell wall biosynthesis